MSNHSQCTVETTPRWERHTCLPCPHGLERGGTITLTGNACIDDRQRRLKLQAIDALSCNNLSHAVAMTISKGGQHEGP